LPQRSDVVSSHNESMHYTNILTIPCRDHYESFVRLNKL